MATVEALATHSRAVVASKVVWNNIHGFRPRVASNGVSFIAYDIAELLANSTVGSRLNQSS